MPFGVIEAYYKLDTVNNQIKDTQIILVIIISTYTVLLFSLLFTIFKIIIIRQIKKIKLQAAALDQVSDHAIITDPDGIILYVNAAAEKLTGYSKAELIGKRPSIWGKQMPQEFYERMWKTIKLDRRSFEGQVNNRRKNGEEYQASVSIAPILDKKGQPSYFVGVERDITNQLQREEKLVAKKCEMKLS